VCPHTPRPADEGDETRVAVALLDQLPGVPGWVVADRGCGYSSHGFREHIWDLGARPAIPPKQNEAPVACPNWIGSCRVPGW